MELLNIERTASDKSLVVRFSTQEATDINNALYQKQKTDDHYKEIHRIWNEFYELLQYGHTIPRYPKPE